MKYKKIILVFVMLLLLAVVVFIVSSPGNFTLLVRNDDGAYIVNTLTRRAKQIRVDGYDRISNVIDYSGGEFWCTAEKGDGKCCILHVANGNAEELYTLNFLPGKIMKYKDGFAVVRPMSLYNLLSLYYVDTRNQICELITDDIYTDYQIFSSGDKLFYWRDITVSDNFPNSVSEIVGIIYADGKEQMFGSADGFPDSACGFYTDGRLMVYSDDSVYLFDTDTKQKELFLADLPEYFGREALDVWLSLSPDGKHFCAEIVFRPPNEPQYQVYIGNLENGKYKRLVPVPELFRKGRSYVDIL